MKPALIFLSQDWLPSTSTTPNVSGDYLHLTLFCNNMGIVCFYDQTVSSLKERFLSVLHKVDNSIYTEHLNDTTCLCLHN